MPNTATQTIVSGWGQLSARRIKYPGWHYQELFDLTIPSETVAARFRRLADQWTAETENMSSIDDMVLHPAYQEIIRMGPPVIPLLIDDIEQSQNYWFYALYSLSGGQNPVPAAHAGDVDKMTEAWIGWARANGYR